MCFLSTARAPQRKMPTAGAGGRIVVPIEALFYWATHSVLASQEAIPYLLTFLSFCGII